MEAYESVSALSESHKVDLVRNKATGGTLARKTVHQRGLLREAAALEACRHPNVVELVEVLQAQDSSAEGCLLLEYLPMDLALLRRFKLQRHQVKATMRQLLQALNFCHDKRGFMHLDIKLENVMIDLDRNLVKLIDFGLSARIEDTRPDPSTGTRGYTAPEMMLGCKDFGPAVDIWSLGVVFAELLLDHEEHPRLIRLDDETFDKMSDYERCKLEFGKMVDLFGVPDEQTWPGVTKLPKYRYLVRGLTSGRGGIRSLFKGDSAHDESTLELLEAMLQMDPSKRITASQALQSRYFQLPNAPEQQQEQQLDLSCYEQMQQPSGMTEPQSVAIAAH